MKFSFFMSPRLSQFLKHVYELSLDVADTDESHVLIPALHLTLNGVIMNILR
jgi:hypothetical protein